MKLGMYIIAPDSISKAVFINLHHQFVCLYVYPSVVAMQRHSKNIAAAKDTRATVEELLDASFSMRSVSYEGNVGD
jgi:hypothetical protein